MKGMKGGGMEGMTGGIEGMKGGMDAMKGMKGMKGPMGYKGEMKGKGGYDWDNGGAEKKRKLGPPDSSQELGQYMGTIKSFSENNGYGFISCPDMQMLGYNDVFLHHQQLNGFQ